MKLNKLIKYLKSKNFEIIIAGDFNADLKNNKKIDQEFKKILEKNKLIAINSIENIEKNIIIFIKYMLQFFIFNSR